MGSCYEAWMGTRRWSNRADQVPKVLAELVRRVTPVRLVSLVIVAAAVAGAGVGHAAMDPDTAASHFGQAPAVWGMRLSPDGHKVSFLKWHPEGFPIAVVIDLRTGKGGLALASDVKKEMDLVGCQWANETRLLCSYYGIHPRRGDFYTATRVVAVDLDGSNRKVLLQRQQRGEAAYHQADVIDLLPDDPEHVLMPIVEDYGQGVARVDIYKNRIRKLLQARRSVWGYWSDGRGNPRIRRDVDKTHSDLQVRLAGEERWRPLHRYEPEDLEDEYWPVGFGPDPDTLFVLDLHEGRIALFEEKLSKAGSVRTLVYSHPEVDLGGVLSLGKFGRPVGVHYTLDRPIAHYFDARVREFDGQIREELGDRSLTFVDESWDRRFYLVHASSDVDGGRYYRFDSESGELMLVTVQHPWLEEEPLAPMTPVRFEAEDGVEVPGYLTRLEKGGARPAPTIVLPHGGPDARDVWGYDWFTQFFASQGYVVLQANYRGSGGYGDAWQGEGGYKGWRRVVADIEAGVRHLVATNVADPERICIVGWSFGGYAALMSAIEHPSRYRCVVSIAGVTDPADLVSASWGLGRRFRKAQIGRDPEVVKQGAPERRASEIQAPVMLVHAEKDINVRFDHGEKMRDALEREDKPMVFVEYEDDDHQIHRQPNRIDMLQRIGVFLETHLTPPKPASKP